MFGPDPEVSLAGELHRGRPGLPSRRARARAGGRHVLVDPLENRLEHLAVVLFHHHHVAVPVDAVIHEAKLFRPASRLPEVRDRARAARRRERGLGGDHDHRNALEILELPRGLFLQPIGLDTGFRRRDRFRFDLGRIAHRWFVRRGNRGEAPDVLAGERPACAFDDDDRLDETRPNLRDEPAKWAARGVRHDDRRPDLVEQHRAALSPDHVRGFRPGRHAAVHRQRRGERSLCAAGTAPSARCRTLRRAPTSPTSPCCRRHGAACYGVGDVGPALRCDHLIEIRRSDLARPRPLVVQWPIGPDRRSAGVGRGELPRHPFERRRELRRERTIQIRMKRRAPVAGAIDDVDLVTLLQQVGRPSRTPVRSAHPVEALSSAAVHEHDGIGMTHLRRDPVLDVHLLAVHDRAAREMRLLDAHPEVAPLGEVEPLRGRSRSARLGRQGRVRRKRVQHRGRAQRQQPDQRSYL